MVRCASLGLFGPKWPQNLININTFLSQLVLHLKLRWKEYLSKLNEETVKITRNSGPNTWSASTSLRSNLVIMFVTKIIKPNFFFWESKYCLETKLSKVYKNFGSFFLVSSPQTHISSQIRQIGTINLKRLHHTLLIQNTIY